MFQSMLTKYTIKDIIGALKWIAHTKLPLGLWGGVSFIGFKMREKVGIDYVMPPPQLLAESSAHSRD